MTVPEVGAVVAGAGIAGLGAALELQQRGVAEVLVIDPCDRAGGVLRTDHVHGYVIERGPNTIQLKAPLLSFLRARSLEGALLKARPASRRRLLFRDGALVPVPLSPWAFARTPLLSLRGKLRLLAEPLLRRGDGAEESVAEFAARRLGREVVENLIGPFLTGVYAGDERELGAAAVFGQLVELERSHRSLALGGLARALQRRRPRGLPGTWSAPQGFGPFARKLAEQLAEPPALGSRVTGLAPDGDAWRVEVTSAGGEERLLRTPRVVVATPAPAAAELLRPIDAEAADVLAAIAYVPIVGIPLGVDPAGVRAPIDGFGFLVPRDAGIPLLGCLFMSQLFPDRAPAGRELLHCMLGGARWAEAIDLPDDTLVEQVRADLERTLGLKDEPDLLAVTRWPQAIPQPDRHHAQRIAELRRRLAGRPGLALAGAYVAGVSVADTLESGLRAAEELSPPA